MILLLVLLLLPASVAAQTSGASDAPLDGGFPEARFEALFRKYTTPETPFSPYYSWDAQMFLDVAIYRKGSGTLNFASTFQTIGTENLGSKVSVGGTGYLLGLGYLRRVSDGFTLSGGFSHLSSHLTRDLDDKIEEEQGAGRNIPAVEDPSEFNIVYVSVDKKFPGWPLSPDLRMIVTPVNFLFTGDDAGYVRPVYIRTKLTFWKGSSNALVTVTEHEIGHNAFNSISLAWQLFATADEEGRFQVFVVATPGRGFHVSPHVGGVRDGLAFGLRLRFPS